MAASSTQPAGRVLEVSGAVTVAGKPLANGDTVLADAVVDTGADGNVVIELLHNNARWQLGPNKHVRVNESLAWKEPKRTAPVAQVEQDTASAGRPAERTAVDTVATANADAPKEPETAPKPTPKERAIEAAKQSGVIGALGGDKPASDTFGAGGLGISGTGEGGGGTGEGTIGIGKIGTLGKGGGGGTGQGYGTGAGRLGGSTSKSPTVQTGTPVVQGSLDKEIIRRIIRRHANRLRFCYEKGLQTNPTLEGRVNVKFVITKDGTVSSAQDAGSTITDQTVVGCVVQAFKQMQFPAPVGGGIVVINYPVVFSPGQ